MLLYENYRCHYSSVVEHVIGNDGVASPILANGTIFWNRLLMGDFFYISAAKFIFFSIHYVLK